MYQTKIKTLHPTINNIRDEQVPIPIETTYFLEDGERDPTKPNRYWFNFPPEWSTSNRGESIVGVRNISTIARGRKLEFDLSIRKYLSSAFDEIKEKDENINKTNDEIYDMIDEKYKGEVSAHIISWLRTENDLRKIFEDIVKIVQPKFEEYNKNVMEKYNFTKDTLTSTRKSFLAIINRYLKPIYGPFLMIKDLYALAFKTNEEFEAFKKELNDFYKSNVDIFIPLFSLNNTSRELNDIQMDGYYDYKENTFIETLFSPTNTHTNYGCYVENPDYEPEPTPEPTQEPQYVKVEENINKILYYVDFKINFLEKNTDENYRRFDFSDVMNIGNKSYQNKQEKYQNKWLRRLDFYNVWDRLPCKIYSSIAEQSSHNYIGDSSVDFTPIKYYKLNSTDQKFWIEFYSGRHNKIPIVIPRNDSFCIDMQFLSYDKLLYV
ncbi:hypothetical protein [uncultured Brachyspira sp.]|uniref:hypothetical protein n=1 Tax=uncultured Brachyspira sp. TaxID=221953 RepID=UPI0026093FAB|nr:hypothetical protein [uncultured Brachyspira sp.]